MVRCYYHARFEYEEEDRDANDVKRDAFATNGVHSLPTLTDRHASRVVWRVN